MREKVILFALGSLLTVGSAQAENFAVSLNPVGILFGVTDLQIEWMGFKNSSVVAGGTYASAKSGSLKATAFGLEGGGRLYRDRGHRGLFAEGGLGLFNMTLKDDWGNKATGTVAYPYALGGYRWGSNFFFDAALGIAYYLGSVKLNGQTIGSFEGIAPRIKLSLGLMF